MEIELVLITRGRGRGIELSSLRFCNARSKGAEKTRFRGSGWIDLNNWRALASVLIKDSSKWPTIYYARMFQVETNYGMILLPSSSIRDINRGNKRCKGVIISLGYLYICCCISNWGEEEVRGVHEGIRKFSKYRYFFGRGNFWRLFVPKCFNKWSWSW